MSPLDQLATQLLIGTDRRAPEWPNADGELGRLLIQIQAETSTSPETTALRLAGVLAVCAAAGFRPPTTDRPPPLPCPEDARSVAAEPELVATLRAILDEGPDALRVLALQRLDAAGYLLPPRLLPQALTLGVQQTDLRPWLPLVVGERGRWLACLHPEWSPALTLDETPPDPNWWDSGTLDQRCRFLAAQRRRDPAEARERLAQTLGETDARGRTRLLAELETGLSLEDQDVLETCLQDRSKEVRRQAGALLARLPDSRYVARLTERVGACLGQTRKRLRQVPTIEPPNAFEPDWALDAIEETAPKGESLGQRAWWLYQLARALPLDWWTRQTGLDPSGCVRWAKSTDWELALLRAWSEALARTPALAWTEAVLNRLPVEGLVLDPLDLVERLPAAECETYWLDLIERPPRGLTLGLLLTRFIQGRMREGQTALSVPGARRLLDRLYRQDGAKRLIQDHSLRRALPDVIACLPDALLDEAASGWPLNGLDSPVVTETQARILAIVRQRQHLNHSLQKRRFA
ncbi:DUF5691 domain-containing protein [Allochromatium palmeri]|uniref:Uncharacterized protein n=1 Tax=Allochromatium palmeri TaxID=231048 RepID=A0A6N8EHV2_9GAMM|nr:DUF5691 domain-containing protein [Allochromatium palmeri]MTW21904.1 hypothetical protein [Allochromatium palmeri]